ncbi:MarR family winged helix-turn-helix transcriptional regulator, partial [Lactococcus lactis]|uniref:MarR family winged helix-turn-helix transcriptional regulator n=1 Tax=Lactococcus lactis TaxID=1358 RepID=UPI003D0A7CE5
DLAIRIGAERSRVSHQTRRLAGEGLVELASNAIDRRATDVTLTPAGRELLRRASPGHIAFVRKVFLNALDGESSAAMAEAFERIYE